MTTPRKPDPTALQHRIHALEAELAACQRLANELRESEERLRILTEATSETIAILERGNVVECNQQVGPMFGYEIAEVLGRPALDFVVPPAREVVAQHIQSGYEQPYEALALRRDGTAFPALFRGKTANFRGRLVRVTVVSDLSGRAPRIAHDPAAQADPVPLPLAPGVVLLPLSGTAPATGFGHALGRLGASAGSARLVLIDVTGVRDLSPGHLEALYAIARELAADGRRTIVTGVDPVVAAEALARRPELAALDARPTLHDAVREALSSGS